MSFAKIELISYPISKVCRLLGVSRSEYYRKPKRPRSEEIKEEQAVINCFRKHNGNYGRIRLRKALCSEGIIISEYRIAKILKKNSLFAKSGRNKRYHRPKPTEDQYIEENLIREKFNVTVPNYLWCSDITELRYGKGKLYLCGVIDVATRRIVGWSISKNQRRHIVLDAFRMAVGRNPVRPDNAVYHSDRGCQYTAKETKRLVEGNDFRKSMSRPGTPNDNQPIESFWQTLEREMPDIRQKTYEEAELTIFKYIELYYNAERLHSGIGYYAPNEFFTLLSVHGD